MAGLAEMKDYMEVLSTCSKANFFFHLLGKIRTAGAAGSAALTPIPADLHDTYARVAAWPEPSTLHAIEAALIAGALPGDATGAAAAAAPKAPRAAKHPAAAGVKKTEGGGGGEGSNGDAAAAAVTPGGRGRGGVAAWAPERQAELLLLADDEAHRELTLGKEGTRGGKVNWAAVARHFGMPSAAAAIRDGFYRLKGEEPPPPRKRAPRASADGAVPAPAGAEEQPPAKRPKPEAAPAVVPAEGGWTAEQGAELVRLVKDEAHRKQATGKRSLKWGRLAEHLGRGKKECKRQFTSLTGEAVLD